VGVRQGLGLAVLGHPKGSPTFPRSMAEKMRRKGAPRPPTNKHTAKKRSEVKQDFEAGVAVATIARSHSVDRGTIYAWAKAGDWQRPEPPEPPEIDKFAPPTVPTIRPKPGAGGSGSGDQPAGVGPAPAGPPDVDAVLMTTIANLSRAIAASMAGRDYRPVAQLAQALVKALETWDKRHPMTAADLADLAVAMKIRPEVFVKALGEAWGLSDAA
jgi:hypothetical protein